MVMPAWVPQPVGVVVGGLFLILVAALAMFVVGRIIVYLAWFISWLRFHISWERMNPEDYKNAYNYWSHYGATEKRKR